MRTTSFSFLLFPATRQYFSSWVNGMLSYALVPLFVAVIASMAVTLSKSMLSDSGSLNDTTLSGVCLASLGNFCLLLLLRVVSNLASSLSAGGINVGTPGGVGSAGAGVSQALTGSARELKALGIPRAPKPAAAPVNSIQRKAG